MIVVYPKYFIMPVVIDTDMNFNTDNGLRNKENSLGEKIINERSDEFFEVDNDFINSQIQL